MTQVDGVDMHRNIEIPRLERAQPHSPSWYQLAPALASCLLLMGVAFLIGWTIGSLLAALI